MRLNKFLASCGVCSRRDADTLIAKGLVTVNGKIASAGQQVDEGDEVCLRGKRLSGAQEKQVVAYYKPVGVTCSERDAHAERLISRELKSDVRLTYAGRLDRDSEGLILMTNDGDLIEAMMRGANGHQKEYVVKVDKNIESDFLEKMRGGVYLSELKQTTRPCMIEQLGPYTFRIILTQGLNRQIRRMCGAFGYQVKKLKRIRILNVKLDFEKPGDSRRITGDELKLLYDLAYGKVW